MDRRVDIEYDALGNIQSRSDKSDGFLYEKTGNAGVHAITQGNGKSYQYDVYGNMVSRGAQNIVYNVFNKPKQIGSSTFVYGPDHSKIKQQTGGRTT